MRDDDLRAVCFLALDALRAQHGDELPFAGVLEQGFTWRGRRVPFFSRQKGIFRAAAQIGTAALAIQTSYRSPYDDEETVEGFRYAYRAGALDQADNRALRAAAELAVPIVYFVATRPGHYRAEYPCYVEDVVAAREVLVVPGRRGITGRSRPFEDADDREYAVRETRQRLHQARFRGLVLPAYSDQCAICRLKEPRLLDAAHIVPDRDPKGKAAVTNGLSLCSIHHRAYDHDLVGVSPRYVVQVSPRLLDDEDGPMLELLKGFHDTSIVLPKSRASRPDPERLADRFERFLAA